VVGFGLEQTKETPNATRTFLTNKIIWNQVGNPVNHPVFA
jgi:hypothetical protein